MFIRVDCDSPFNGKMARLRHACGMAGFGSLVTLWCWCGIYRQNGDLGGLRDEEIEQIALWSGTPGLFVITLKSCALFDGDSEHFRIHDWNHTQDFMSQLHRKKRDADRKRRARRPRSVRRTSAGHPVEKPRKIEMEIESKNEKEIEKEQERSKPARTKQRAAPEGFAPFKDWAYAQWLASGEVGKWGVTEWVRLADAYKLLGDEAARRSWANYLDESDRFYAGHLPRKWSSEPQRWARNGTQPTSEPHYTRANKAALKAFMEEKL